MRFFRCCAVLPPLLIILVIDWMWRGITGKSITPLDEVIEWLSEWAR